MKWLLYVAHEGHENPYKILVSERNKNTPDLGASKG